MITFIQWLWRPVRIPFLLYALMVTSATLKAFSVLVKWLLE